jgi:FkbM family methyltransferase
MKQRVLSYAQEGEDLVLFLLLDDIEKGLYVDVGANDPWHFSVTKLFYELGWSGINIEPLSGMYAELCKDRPRDINLNIGAGDKSGTLKLYGIDMGATFCEPPSGGGEGTTIEVKTLTDVVCDSIGTEKDIHFCKIDVEGFEKEVLNGIDFDIIRPWIFAIESTLPGTDIPCYEKWEYILIKAGYIFAYSQGINRYYIDKTRENLLKKVDFLSNYQEKYDIYYVDKNRLSDNKYYKLGHFVAIPFLPFYRFAKKIIKRKK